MKRIVSVSRRTDVPAYYGDWFINRLKEGFAEYRNPYSGKAYRVSLLAEDVACFAFWSKNFSPFLSALERIARLGYNAIFNFTITGLDRSFEPESPAPDSAIDCAKRLSDVFSPMAINWRYDPIVLSNRTSEEYQVDTFSRIASRLEGFINRVYVSFVCHYAKVRKSFERLRFEENIAIYEPCLEDKIALSSRLAKIAASYGMSLHSCSDDSITGGLIRKGHCIDGDVIKNLFAPDECGFSCKPTRKDCGCAESVDIGAYDTCPNGCVYCYANPPGTAGSRGRHDPESPFLGNTI